MSYLSKSTKWKGRGCVKLSTSFFFFFFKDLTPVSIVFKEYSLPTPFQVLSMILTVYSYSARFDSRHSLNRLLLCLTFIFSCTSYVHFLRRHSSKATTAVTDGRPFVYHSSFLSVTRYINQNERERKISWNCELFRQPLQFYGHDSLKLLDVK